MSHETHDIPWMRPKIGLRILFQNAASASYIFALFIMQNFNRILFRVYVKFLDLFSWTLGGTANRMSVRVCQGVGSENFYKIQKLFVL